MDLLVLKEVENIQTGLICVIGPPGSGKTFVLKEISSLLKCEILNLNKFISEKIYSEELIPDSQNIDDFFRNSARNNWGPIICFDNTEMIFSVLFRDLFPFSTFASISRNSKVIMTISARIQGNYLQFGESGHVDNNKIVRKEIDAKIYSLEKNQWV